MGVAYQSHEIISATKAAKAFGKLLSTLLEHHQERVVVAKHNALKAVILPIEDYERMAALADLVEHAEIYGLVTSRRAKDKGRRVRLDDLLKEEGIAL